MTTVLGAERFLQEIATAAQLRWPRTGARRRCSLRAVGLGGLDTGLAVSVLRRGAVELLFEGAGEVRVVAEPREQRDAREPLPFPDADRPIYIGGTAPGMDLPADLGVPDELYLEYDESVPTIEDLGTYGTGSSTTRAEGHTEQPFPTPGDGVVVRDCRDLRLATPEHSRPDRA